MARALSRTLALTRFSIKSIPRTTATAISRFQLPQPASVSDRRYRSTRTAKAQLIEVDIDSSSSSSSDGAEVLGLKKLEDVIHGIIVRRSAPDWLPFRPGSSYWVPPKPRADSILQLVGKLTNPMTKEETLSFSSVRGWPSSSFFTEGSAFPDPPPVGMKVHVQVESESDSDDSSESEDEE